jgi:excisionase family DNA binding protein
MRKESRTVGVREAARILNCSLKYIYDLLYLGKLPAKKVARQWRISAAAVESRLKQMRG